MRLYIANATKQNVDFLYRLPEVTGVRRQAIAIGTQELISGDLTRDNIDYIVEQHARYGLIEVSEIGTARAFNGLCYSVDKPIPAARIEQLITGNTQQLVARGEEIRKEAAITSNDMLGNAMEEAGGPAAPRVNRFEMSIVEENPDDRDGHDPIAQGVRVEPEPDGAPRRGGRRRR